MGAKGLSMLLACSFQMMREKHFYVRDSQALSNWYGSLRSLSSSKNSISLVSIHSRTERIHRWAEFRRSLRCIALLWSAGLEDDRNSTSMVGLSDREEAWRAIREDGVYSQQAELWGAMLRQRLLINHREFWNTQGIGCISWVLSLHFNDDATNAPRIDE